MSRVAPEHMPSVAVDHESHRSRAVHFGWVSLLQDLGSKMVVPVLPLFLALELEAGALAIGLIDGLGALSAAAVAPLVGRRAATAPVFLVRVGYALSSAMKLALAAVTIWPAALAVRLVDRAGKGIRDAPRDLLLAESPSESHGRTFGIQQAMDKTGGVIGPIVGLAVYTLANESFDAVFIVAFVPCALSVALLARIPKVATPVDPSPVRTPPGTAAVTPAQRRALVAIALHSVGFVSVSLLLLRALDADASVSQILVGFSILRLVTAVSSYPAGRLVDRFSARSVSAIGMFISAVAVATLAVAPSTAIVWVGLATVGLADALTKAPTKAWLVSLGPAETRGAVLGDRSAVTGVGALVGALAVGAAWNDSGTVALLVAASISILGAGLAATSTTTAKND